MAAYFFWLHYRCGHSMDFPPPGGYPPPTEISATNERPVLANMALVVIVGFQNVQVTPRLP